MIKHLSANIKWLLNYASSFKTTKARDKFARGLNCKDFADLCMELGKEMGKGYTCITSEECDNRGVDGACAGHPSEKDSSINKTTDTLLTV